MVREVVTTDDEGQPAVIAYRDTDEEKAERRAAEQEQAERARDVEESLSERAE